MVAGFSGHSKLDPPPLRLPGASPQTSTQRASFSEDGALWAAINDIDPSGDGKELAPAGTGAPAKSTRITRVWETDTGRPSQTLTEPRGREGWRVSSNGHRLAIIGDDKEYGPGRLVAWDVPSGKQLWSHTLGKFNWYNFVLALDKTGDRVFLLQDDGKVSALNATTGDTTASYSLVKANLREPHLSTNRLDIASRDGMAGVHAWDLASGQPLLGEGIKHYGKDLTCGPVLSPDRRRIALVHRQPGAFFGRDLSADVISLWDATGRETATFKGHEGAVYDLSFSPDSRSLASIASDGTVRIWDTTTGQQTLSFPAFPASIPNEFNREGLGVAFCGDGSRLAAYDKQQTLIWLATVRPTHLRLKGHTAQVTGVAFGDDGASLASAGDDGKVFVWDVARGEEVRRFIWPNRNFDQLPARVGIQDGGRTAFCIGQDRTLVQWDVESGSVLPRSAPMPKAELCTSFDRNGHRAATAKDQAVLVWETGSGKEIAYLPFQATTLHGCGSEPRRRAGRRQLRQQHLARGCVHKEAPVEGHRAISVDPVACISSRRKSPDRRGLAFFGRVGPFVGSASFLAGVHG